MDQVAAGVDALVEAAFASISPEPEPLQVGVPLVPGWSFDVAPSGLRRAQSIISVDLHSWWRKDGQHPEIADAKKTLIDALLPEHADSLTRIGLNAGDIPPKQVAAVVVDLLLWRTAGLLDGSARWDTETAPDDQTLKRRLAHEVQRFLAGDPAEADVICPLSFCDTELTASVEIGEGLRLVPMDAGRATRLLAGTLASYGVVSPSEAHNWHLAVVAIASPDVRGSLDSAFSQIEDVVTSLRLLRHSAVGVVHHFIRPQGLSLRERGSGVHVGARTIGASLNITSADIANVITLTSPGASSKEGRLALAIRRLSSAESRSSAEDRLIDYWVGLEAIYGIGGNNEVGYRISIRMAHTLRAESEAQRSLFKRVKESYNLRSDVVHGNVKRLNKVTRERADEAESWLRESIRAWWGTAEGPSEAHFDKALFRD